MASARRYPPARGPRPRRPAHRTVLRRGRTRRAAPGGRGHRRAQRGADEKRTGRRGERPGGVPRRGRQFCRTCPRHAAGAAPRSHPCSASRLAAAAAVGAVALGGAAAAAYTGALPAPVQKLAHYTIGAPSAHHSAPSTPVGSGAAGRKRPVHAPVHHHVTHLNAHGRARQKAVDFRNLAAAAGGAANVKAFCASVAHPGTSARPASRPIPPVSRPLTPRASRPAFPPASRAPSHGKPSGLPTGRPSSHPTGKPSPPYQ